MACYINHYFKIKNRINIKVTATDGDKDRPENIVYFLTGQGIDTDRPDQSKFDINKTTGEIFVLKVIKGPAWKVAVSLSPETICWDRIVSVPVGELTINSSFMVKWGY